MDSTHFDRFAAALTGQTGRRDTLRLLGASLLGVGGLALLGADESEAGKKRRKRKKNKKKNKNKNRNRCLNVCGGTCPRCAVGTTCTTRDECSTAFCDGGVCAAPANPAQCGTDTDGNMCATRKVNNVETCTRINGTFIAGGSCSQCPADEVCFIPNDSGVECLKLCGDPV